MDYRCISVILIGRRFVIEWNYPFLFGSLQAKYGFFTGFNRSAHK